ncbi:MAG: hypothetical protein ACLUKQ_11460, partial [Peptococcaceae bacterium]
VKVQFHRPVGQYLLQRPHAALDISWPVHLSQTASATIGQSAEISIQRWTFCKDIVLLVIGEKANANGVMGYADRKGIVV